MDFATAVTQFVEAHEALHEAYKLRAELDNKMSIARSRMDEAKAKLCETVGANIQQRLFNVAGSTRFVLVQYSPRDAKETNGRAYPSTTVTILEPEGAA